MKRRGTVFWVNSTEAAADSQFVFAPLRFDSQLKVRPINILYGASPAVLLTCAVVLNGSRWRGWMLVIVTELFNMLDAGALLFISLTPVWFGGLTALYGLSTLGFFR